MQAIIEETLRGAGVIALRYFGQLFTTTTKNSSPHSVVTPADLECEQYIIEKLTRDFPHYGVVAEESGVSTPQAEFVWYVDPIDGTRNFATRVPLFGISIALAYQNTITHGGIYLPATNEFVYAEKGKGAFINGHKMTCSEKNDFKGSIGIGMVSAKLTSIAFLQEIQKLTENTAWVNSMGCVVQSAVWVADGRRDYYFTPNPNPWDLAAASLILEEAGCTVTDFKGETWEPGKRGLVAANQYLHPALVEIARKIFT